MSEIARIIDAVLAESLAPALKPTGYRRSARTWRRVGLESTRVVNAQGSTRNSAEDGQFTVNLGLYFPALAALVAWGRTSERPTEPDCQVRMRIGRLLPGGLDHWWAVTPATNVTTLAAEGRDAWDRYAAPWLEAYDDLEAARPLVAEQYAYGSAAVNLGLGERGEAERLAAEALAHTAQRGRADVIRGRARQHGLTIAAAWRIVEADERAHRSDPAHSSNPARSQLYTSAKRMHIVPVMFGPWACASSGTTPKARKIFASMRSASRRRRRHSMTSGR